MTARAWSRRAKAHVAARLAAGERPRFAMPTATGPVDGLVAWRDGLGAMAAVAGRPTDRYRPGRDDALLVRTLAVLPFMGNGGSRGPTEVRFGGPALPSRPGRSPARPRQGDNDRRRHPDGRQPEALACPPGTPRGAPARIGERAWPPAQAPAVRGLLQRRLVRGAVYAVDGTGPGTAGRVVAPVRVTAQRPIIGARRHPIGTASAKGKEAVVRRTLIERAPALGGPDRLRSLPADALYADGPRPAWLQYGHGSDALVRPPAARPLCDDPRRLAARGCLARTGRRYPRVRHGPKDLRTVGPAGLGGRTTRGRSREAAAR